MGSLLSTIVIRILESIISKLAMGEISIFKLVFVAEQAGLSLTFSENPKTGFVATRPISTLNIWTPDPLTTLVLKF